MTVLLDPRVLLWALSAPEQIPERERGVLEDGANRVLYSAAGVWEIAISVSIFWVFVCAQLERFKPSF